MSQKKILIFSLTLCLLYILALLVESFLFMESGNITFSFEAADAVEIMTGRDDGIRVSRELLPNQTVNINVASQEELMLLPGIGEKLAESIVEYRTENGKFRYIEDIMDVDGIGKGKFNAIKDIIVIGE